LSQLWLLRRGRFGPGGGTVIADVGRLIFDDEGNVIFEARSHPALHGDFTARGTGVPSRTVNHGTGLA
jgi:hypothetical protein